MQKWQHGSDQMFLEFCVQRPVLTGHLAWFGPGIGFAVLAMASLSFSDATSKWVMLSVTPLMVLWFRYAVQALGTTMVLAPLRGRAMWHTHSLRWQVLRGMLMVSCSLLTSLFACTSPVSTCACAFSSCFAVAARSSFSLHLGMQ